MQDAASLARENIARRNAELEQRQQRARDLLAAYVARRRAAGATVEIEQDAYTCGFYTRAVLVISGTRRRMYLAGTWKYA